MAQLSVELTANISRLEKSLSSAKKALQDYGEQAENANKPLKNPPKDPFKPVAISGQRATNVITNFGRVIQDAPFGIQGVANNIDQLGESLTRFIKDAGGGSQALRAIGAAILSPAGILVGVSAITSALIAFGPEIKEFVFQTSEAEKTQRAFNEAIREGVGQAQSELSVLNSLLLVARDVSKTTNDRQKAIARINQEYGDYLPNITEENINTEAVTGAIDKYSEALLRNAKIKGAQNLIAEEYAKILELQTSNALDNVGALDVIASAFSNIGNNATAAADLTVRGFQNQNKEISETERRIAAVQRLLNELIATDINQGGIATAVKTTVDKAILDLPTPTFDDSFLAKVFGYDTNSLNIFLTEASKRTAQIIEKINKQINDNVEAKEEGPSPLEKLITGLNDRASDLLNTTIVQGLSNVGTAIGQAIATGGNALQAAGNALLGTFGQFLSRMGQLLIEYGTLAVLKGKLDIAIAKGGPLSIGAGIAAIAVGTALAAAGAALSQASQGGFRSEGSGSFSGGSRSFTGASSSSFSSSAGGGEVVFEIAGTKLVGVLNRTLKKDRRTVADII